MFNQVPKINFTQEQVKAVYDEVDRRIELDIKDGDFKWESEIVEYRKAMLQGVYSVLMSLAPNRNWQDTTWWIQEEEEKRYGNELKPLRQWEKAH